MRALLRRMHRWCGLLLAVPLLLQGLSGTVLTLEPVFAELAAPVVTRGQPQPASAIVHAAQSVAGPGLRVARYVPPAHPGLPAFVQYAAPAGSGVQIDPVSLEVLGQENGGGPLAWIKALHTNLLTTDRSGRSLIGWLGVGLLCLAVLGVPLWWPANGQWRTALTIDGQAQGWRFHRRLHGAAGIWSVALLASTAATGIVLAFPQTVRSTLGLAEATRPTRQPVSPNLPPIDLDRAIALAASAIPNPHVRLVILPNGAGEPVRVLLAPEGSDGVAAISSVTVDAAGRRILSLQDARTLPAAERTLRWAHDLHFGQGFGPIWRVLTIITGLVLPLFAVTGAAMWWLRRRRRMLLATPL